MDDKLGSWWIYLPMPKDMRESKATSSLYRYHQCVQGNSYPGHGNFMSLVPPTLHTGNNFGCTAFCVTLYELIKAGKVASNQTTLVRNTDSGSDNDGKITHIVHYVLVREGACDQLDWMRLPRGHSHNGQDLTFADAKAIFYPSKGRGPGCDSPFEFHAKLTDGLKTMSGGCELLWQLTNFNFTSIWKGCLHKDFGQIKYATHVFLQLPRCLFVLSHRRALC